MKHSEECESFIHDYELAVAAYRSAWPNYCTNCAGWGAFVSSGCSVPYGSTYVSLPDEVEPCPICCEQGICPRCGHQEEAIAEKGECSQCSWTEGTEGLPELPECVCGMNEYMCEWY